MKLTLPWPPHALSPNARVHVWTESELEFLRKNWRRMEHKEIAEALGRTASAVRSKCSLVGLVDKSSDWTPQQVDVLRRAYAATIFDNDLKLGDVAAALGKHKSNVCRKARELGLTNQARAGLPPEVRKVRVPKFTSASERSAHMSLCVKAALSKNGHPRGMLGKKHTAETKARIGEISKARSESMTEEDKAAIAMKSMRTRAANGTYAPLRQGTTWKSGWRDVGAHRKYFRSRWEANYARYLEWLRARGDIADWKHEPTTFWFDGVKRGSVSYLPDFWVVENGGKESFHEVKGWMDERSKTKLRRMAKYHPDVTVVVIREKDYNEIKRKLSSVIPGWEG